MGHIESLARKLLRFLALAGRKGLVIVITPDNCKVLYSVQEKEERRALIKEVIAELSEELVTLNIDDGEFYES